MTDRKPAPVPSFGDDLNYRYQNDRTWSSLVDFFQASYARGEFTASDVRTAAIYAMVRHEMVNPRPIVIKIHRGNCCGQCFGRFPVGGKCDCTCHMEFIRG